MKNNTQRLGTISSLNSFYDVLIGMDWLEAGRVKLDCYNKTFECMDEEGTQDL